MPVLLPASGEIDVSAFEPYVLPSAPTVPLTLFEQMVRTVAAEFCRKTLVWTETLPDTVTEVDTEVYELERPDDSTVIKLVSLAVGEGKPPTIVTYSQGLRMKRDPYLVPGAAAFLDTESKLHLVPSPTVAGLTIKVDAALAPTLTGTVLPGLLAEYVDDVARGVLGRLFAMPKCDWTDKGAAALERAEYMKRVNALAVRVGRGMSSAGIGKADPSSRFF